MRFLFEKTVVFSKVGYVEKQFNYWEVMDSKYILKLQKTEY